MKTANLGQGCGEHTKCIRQPPPPTTSTRAGKTSIQAAKGTQSTRHSQAAHALTTQEGRKMFCLALFEKTLRYKIHIIHCRRKDEDAKASLNRNNNQKNSIAALLRHHFIEHLFYLKHL